MPVILKLSLIYKVWNEYLLHFPRNSKFTLGTKIDNCLIESIESTIIATYLGKSQKIPYLRKSLTKIDLAKFFLNVCWENKILDNKKYIHLSEQLNEIGKMLNGWLKKIEKETPAK